MAGPLAFMAVLIVMLAVLIEMMRRELHKKRAFAGPALASPAAAVVAPVVAAAAAAPAAPPEPEAMSNRLRSIRARVLEEALDSPLLEPESPPTDPVPPMVEEPVSVVLRKQIPPRNDAPRSWLGGLPMLPADVEWPLGVNPEKADEGAVPLHFIAQVACADLPEALWGGLGPREGWLLLFVNGNTCFANDPGVWRVLHVAELGEERAAPAALGPIHDGVYCSATPYTLRERVFPRWPVDVVCVPNQLREENGRMLAAPANFAAQLYPGEAIDEAHLSAIEVAPFTWRCLVQAIDRTVAQLIAPPAPETERYRGQMRDKLADPGAFKDIVPALERRGADSAVAVAELLAAHPTPADLIDRIEREGEAEWREDIAERLTELRAIAADEGLDQPMGAEHWAAAQAALGSFDKPVWALAWGRSEEGKLPVTVERRTLSALTLLEPALRAESVEVAAACYRDPTRRDLIPAAAREALEAHWRALHQNRPHRMGGYHDGLQSDAQAGPAATLLLMQFAVDDALEWVWGDNGAVYCFIRPEDLEAGAWGRAEFHLECH